MKAMTTKRVVLISLLPLSIAVTLGVLMVLPPRTGVTKANFDRIETGMTLAEVEEIFGEKATLMGGGGDKFMLWETGEGFWTDMDFVEGRLVHMEWHTPETLLDKLCRWFHLR